MKIEEIAALGADVMKIALPDSHLYLWVTNNYLEKSFHVVKEWGFKYITAITWRKPRKGLGQYFRGTTEHTLFCRRGMPPYRSDPNTGKRAQGLTDFEDEGWYFEAERTLHSRKPTMIHEWAEKVSPGPYLEMFARTRRPGWESWGNEITESLEDVLS